MKYRVVRKSDGLFYIQFEIAPAIWQDSGDHNKKYTDKKEALKDCRAVNGMYK